MRHLKAGRKLGRNATHRLAMKRNLAMALFRHERIITTVEKAKEVRPFVEKLITLAKKGTLHARRLVIARLGTPSKAEVQPDEKAGELDDRTVLTKLFNEIGPRFATRPGGYTRIIKRHERRLGDGGKTAFLELLKEGEVKVRTKAPAPAPAPRVEAPPAPPPAAAPTPEAPPTPAPEAAAPTPQAAPEPEVTSAAPAKPPAAQTPPEAPK
jgi:large subunit ribosomal protein L17